MNSYSGTNYDRWSYEQAAKGGTLADTPINKLQHKFWVAKQKVSRKLGKEEDEHIVASDSQLDAKLELYKSIESTTCRLQFLMEQYQDRIYFLAGEENALGRFLKEEGKKDKTRAGKMMIAAGKTMSYTGQQRLAIRVPLVRLYQEVETFRLRAIKDMKQTVETMEKVRNEYRGALMWMKNVSTELDPDTFRQLEKFRKVQIHVKDSKKRFDKLAVDCLQKIDLLAASRCNMFSHALIMYQNTLVSFWDKTAKTMNHVNNGFKDQQEGNDKQKQSIHSKESGSKTNLLDLNSKYQFETVVNVKDGGFADDDEILLNIDTELQQEKQQHSPDFNKIFESSKLKAERMDDDLLSLGHTTQEGLDRLLDDGQTGAFTKEWEQHCANQRRDSSGFDDFVSSRAGDGSAFLPSQLVSLQTGGASSSDLSFLDISKVAQQQGGNLQQNLMSTAGSGSAASSSGQTAQQQRVGGGAAATKQKERAMADWYSMFAELDPLANPVGSSKDCL